MEKLISQIKIKNRIRKDFGDISALVESIKRVGLINPIVINTKNELLAGERRLIAMKQLGWKKVPVRIFKSKTKLSKIDIEIEENISRSDFSHKELERGLKIRNELRYRMSQGPIIRFLLWLWYLITSLFASKDA